MRILQKIFLIAMLAVLVAGCATKKVVVIDSQSDWVKIGPNVKGKVYTWDHTRKAWALTSQTVTLPEGWVAGPEPK